jgi:hypothetical protein
MGQSLPLTYSGGLLGSGCASCSASATVRQLLAVARTNGSSAGLGQIFEIGIGATGYSDFEVTNGSGNLGPEGIDWDLTLALGGGLTLRMGRNAAVELVQSAQISPHQRTGLSASEQQLTRMYVTRVGFRYRF